MIHGWDTGRQPVGRPAEVSLEDPEHQRELARIFLRTNRTRTDGSARMAWDLFLERHPEIGWERNESKHSIPEAARVVCRRARALVGYHRQGEKWMATGGPSSRGDLRRHWVEDRRLYAGEKMSHDDGTINLGVWIPWPWGGVGRCSDRYKVMLGRFQLLLSHDEASSFIPAWSYVIRPMQAYRGPETAGHLLRVERDVCMPDFHVIEGGVWQGKRVLGVLGDRWIDVKGRPRQKLVENRFGPLWTRLAAEFPGQVGRFRGEMKEETRVYLRCRDGKEDPRRHFVGLEEFLPGLERCIRWLNADQVESPRYGKWVPGERWEGDLAEAPRPVRAAGAEWLAAPAGAERVVRDGGVTVTEPGPWGVKMQYIFQAAWLMEWNGRQVEVYFDPLGEWPLHAWIVRGGKLLGRAECGCPIGDRRHRDVVRAIRAAVRAEYRAIWTPDGGGGVSETTVRTPAGVVEISGRGLGDRQAGSGEREGRALLDHEARLNGAGRSPAACVDSRGRAQIFRDQPGGDDPEDHAPGVSLSLRLRAEASRGLPPNW